MTTKAKEKQEKERRPLNKYYKSTRHISWIEIIPEYVSPREAAALSTEEKERLLKPFERPRFPLPDLPPLARIRLFRQDLLGAESINRFHYCCQDPRPIPDIRKKWKLELYIQNKEREWHILGGAERQRQGIGKPFYLNLWENLDTIDLIQSERFEHWERKAGRIQYEFRTRISNRGKYLASYRYNSSGYNQGPFNREFHKRQVIKEYSASINNGPQHENHKK
jgi:hypothetical protein